MRFPQMIFWTERKESRQNKTATGTKLIYELLADGNAVTIRELDEKAKAQGISQRTMREARSRMKENWIIG